MGGGEMPYKVPDWKIYQVGKHTPELEQVQRMLGSLGLKVRWIRTNARRTRGSRSRLDVVNRIKIISG